MAGHRRVTPSAGRQARPLVVHCRGHDHGDHADPALHLEPALPVFTAGISNGTCLVDVKQ